GAAGHRVEDLLHPARVGTGREDGLLRAPQLGRRDHLHGLGDLLRVLHAADAAADVDEGRHGSLVTVLAQAAALPATWKTSPNSLSAALRPSATGARSFFSASSPSSCGCRRSRKLYSSVSYRRAWATG